MALEEAEVVGIVADAVVEADGTVEVEAAHGFGGLEGEEVAVEVEAAVAEWPGVEAEIDDERQAGAAVAVDEEVASPERQNLRPLLRRQRRNQRLTLRLLQMNQWPQECKKLARLQLQ